MCLCTLRKTQSARTLVINSKLVTYWLMKIITVLTLYNVWILRFQKLQLKNNDATNMNNTSSSLNNLIAVGKLIVDAYVIKTKIKVKKYIIN